MGTWSRTIFLCFHKGQIVSFTHYHDNRIVGSVWEKHIQGYGLVSTRDLILFTFHDISFNEIGWKVTNFRGIYLTFCLSLVHK